MKILRDLDYIRKNNLYTCLGSRKKLIKSCQSPLPLSLSKPFTLLWLSLGQKEFTLFLKHQVTKAERECYYYYIRILTMLIWFALVIPFISFADVRIRLHSSFIQTKMLLLSTFTKPMDGISFY